VRELQEETIFHGVGAGVKLGNVVVAVRLARYVLHWLIVWDEYVYVDSVTYSP
jgi:hypothetical protein